MTRQVSELYQTVINQWKLKPRRGKKRKTEASASTGNFIVRETHP
jgi:hypothetical protein